MKKIFLSVSVFLIFTTFLNAQIPTNGLMLYYPFNGNANDASGNSYNGTVTNAQLTTDRFNNPNSAYYFDNPNIISRIANNPGVDLNNKSFTISTWASLDNQEYGYFPIIAQGSEFAYQGYSLGIAVYGDAFASFSNWSSDLNLFGSIQNYSDWHHYLVSFNITNQTINLYIDGILIATQSNINPLSGGCYGSNYLGVSVGSKGSGGATLDKFNGKIDDVRIYNRQLSSSEIEALYNENKTTAIFGKANNNQSYKLFPNPVKDIINVSDFFNKNYSIVNQQGTVVKSGIINSNYIDVSELFNGIYFIQINNIYSKFIKE